MAKHSSVVPPEDAPTAASSSTSSVLPSQLFFKFFLFSISFMCKELINWFVAECLGLPLVPPFHGGENLDGGGSVNFAAASANALPDSFFVGKGIQLPNPNISLGDQLHWFKDLFLPRFYNNSSGQIIPYFFFFSLSFLT